MDTACMQVPRGLEATAQELEEYEAALEEGMVGMDQFPPDCDDQVRGYNCYFRL